MSRLYEYFKWRWYYRTIEIEQLEKAVTKTYITQQEYEQIIESEQQEL